MPDIPKNMPFEFVLDFLHPLEYEIKPMFGCFGIYSSGQLLLFLRDRDSDKEENGIWVAATPDGVDGLATDLGLSPPTGNSEKKWLLLKSDTEGFETKARKVCEMILEADKRIGR